MQVVNKFFALRLALKRRQTCTRKWPILTLKRVRAQVVEVSVMNVTKNCPTQDYSQPDDLYSSIFETVTLLRVSLTH